MHRGMMMHCYPPILNFRALFLSMSSIGVLVPVMW